MYMYEVTVRLSRKLPNGKIERTNARVTVQAKNIPQADTIVREQVTQGGWYPVYKSHIRRKD